MTDHTDLIARLRTTNFIQSHASAFRARTKDCHEAADALEAQGRRLAEAEALLREAAAIFRADTDQRRRNEYSCVIDAFLGREK